MFCITLGYGCNNACEFCAQGALREREGGALDVESAVVSAAKDGGAIALVGGEPTIDPRLLDLARLAKESGATRVVVQTNGRRLAYRAFASALFEAGVDAVDVSLHGATAPMHDYHTAVAGSFAQTLTGIGVARRAGLVVGVTTVVTRSNYRHLAELARLVAARGASAIHLATLVVAGRAVAARERLAPSGDLTAPYVASAREAARSLGLSIVVGEPPDEHPIFAGTGPAVEEAVAPSRVASSSPRALPVLSGTGGRTA